jgi:hypothetical protein
MVGPKSSQVFQRTSTSIPSISVGLNNLWNFFWGEWQFLADQLCAMISYNFLDFEDFMRRLDFGLKRNETALSALDTMPLLWLINQTMPFETMKQTLLRDFQKNGGQMARSILSLKSISVLPDLSGIEEILSASVDCVSIRLRAIYPDFSLSSSIPTFQEKYLSWWKEISEKSLSHCTLDLFNPSNQDLIRLSVLSSVSSSPVADKILEIFSFQCESQWVQLPGQVFCGKQTRPIPMSLIMALSVQCRMRLASSFENEIFRQRDNVEAVAPGILDSFCRILYSCPNMLEPSIMRILKYFVALDSPMLSFTLLEMVTHRLIRLLKHRMVLHTLFNSLLRVLAQCSNHQLYGAVVNLLSHMSLHCESLIALEAAVAEVPSDQVRFFLLLGFLKSFRQRCVILCLLLRF